MLALLAMLGLQEPTRQEELRRAYSSNCNTIMIIIIIIIIMTIELRISLPPPRGKAGGRGRR